MKKMCLLFACTLLLSALASPLLAAGTQSDVAREKRWSEQIVDQLIDGEAVWLEGHHSSNE